MKKRKRKLNTLGKLFIITLILIPVIFIVKNTINDNKSKNSITNNEQDKTNNNAIINEFITNNKESDSEIIDTIFEEGMKTDDFTEILNQKPNYIKSSGNYEEITYNFDKILHYSEIEDLLNQMNKSSIVSLEIIGKSVDGRNIYGIEVGKGNKVLYLDADVHAAEIANTLILIRFLSEIVNEYENGNTNIVSALNNVKIAVIPSINPDGYEIYNFGIESINNKNLWWYENKDKINFENIKSNANGVDLNRNFPTQNTGMYYVGKKLISNTSLEKTTANGKYFNGYVVGSEPETRAAMYFMLKHCKNVYAYINMHSQGRVIYAGKPNLSNEFNELTKSFANKVSTYNNYKVHGLSAEEVGEGNDGSVTDFMAELANGFKFSTQTGRLSTDKYIDNSATFDYKYPVITMETITTYTTNPSVFKDEYYNHGLRNLLYDLLNPNF